jgi:CheY-like chemotaxis protein
MRFLSINKSNSILPMESDLSFSFKTSELAEQLKQTYNESLTGYWQISIADRNDPSKFKAWYLAVLRGKVVFSGAEKLSWTSFIKTLQRYISRLRSAQSKQALQSIEEQVGANSSLGKLSIEMQKSKLLSQDEVLKALQSGILCDLDSYLFNSSGKASFVAEAELVVNAPIQGFEIPTLIAEATKRKNQWQQLANHLPSLGCKLVYKAEAAQALPPEKQQQLEKMLAGGKTLERLALDLGKEPLEVAKIFISWIEKGVIQVIKSQANSANDNTKKEIFIVDDSPIVIQQFQHLVTKWGYQVNYSNDANSAVDKMVTCNPTAIFLDINMPGLTGFDLIKLIRRQPKLASTPVVLLTAEKTVANQWRAQWANCKFLAKPRTPEESQKFPSELRSLLEEMTTAPEAAPV